MANGSVQAEVNISAGEKYAALTANLGPLHLAQISLHAVFETSGGEARLYVGPDTSGELIWSRDFSGSGTKTIDAVINYTSTAAGSDIEFTLCLSGGTKYSKIKSASATFSGPIVQALAVAPEKNLYYVDQSHSESLTFLIQEQYEKSLQVQITNSAGRVVSNTEYSPISSSFGYYAHSSDFDGADTTVLTVQVTDNYGRSASCTVNLISVPDLTLTRSSPFEVVNDDTVHLTIGGRLSFGLTVTAYASNSTGSVVLQTYEDVRTDALDVVVNGDWRALAGWRTCYLRFYVEDAETGRRSSDVFTEWSPGDLSLTKDKETVGIGGSITLTIGNRHEPVNLTLKNGAAQISQAQYTADEITLSPDLSWFEDTGETGDVMTVTVVIDGVNSARQLVGSFVLTRPPFGVTATSQVTSGGDVTLSITGRNNKAVSAVLRHEDVVLASTAAASVDSITVTTADSWFNTAGVTDQSWMEVTAVITDSDGRTASTSFWLNASTGMRPAISAIVFTAVQPSDAMENKFSGVYVEGYTRLKVAATVTAKQGASVSTVSFTPAGSQAVQMSYNSGTGKWEGVTPVPVTANGSVVLTATDSRGLSGQGSKSFSSLTPYSAPGISAVSFHRCREDHTRDDTGGYCELTATFTISPVQNLNDKTAKIESSAYNNTQTMSAYTQTITYFFAVNSERSYDIVLKAIDAINTTPVTVRLSTAGVIMDFLAGGKGIGLGKVAETQNCVEVNPEWTFKANSIQLAGTDLGTLLTAIQQRLTNGGL